MEWTVDWRLRAWMALLCPLIALLAVATVLLELALFFATYIFVFVILLMGVILAFAAIVVLLLWLGVPVAGESSIPWFSLTVLATVVAFFGYLTRLIWRTFTPTDTADLVDAPVEEADPELAARVDRLAIQADLPAPEVLVAHTDDPVVLSSGFRLESSTILVSERVLATLDGDELDAVLAHVGNRDAAILTASSLPRRLVTQSQAAQPPLVSAVIEIVAGTLAAALGRKREFAADDGAVAITGDPAALASALDTLDSSVAATPKTDLRDSLDVTALSIIPIERGEETSGYLSQLSSPFRRRLYRTHPPTERRIERLRRRIR